MQGFDISRLQIPMDDNGSMIKGPINEPINRHEIMPQRCKYNYVTMFNPSNDLK